mgnify:CR=1 FL=1
MRYHTTFPLIYWTPRMKVAHREAAAEIVRAVDVHLCSVVLFDLPMSPVHIRGTHGIGRAPCSEKRAA